MKIMVGLGNPGQEYETTRHNAGCLAINALAAKRNLAWSANKKCQVELARSNELMLVKPLTFMNNSGQAVRAVLAYYHLLPKKLGFLAVRNADLSRILFVIHDDIDLPLGGYKVSVDSGSAGHKGVASIIANCKTKNFTRLRLGIRTDAAAQIPTDKFVLQKFSDSEIIIINDVISRALAEEIFTV